MRKSIALIMVMTYFQFIQCYVYGQTSSTVTNIGIDAKVIAPITGSYSTELDFGTLTRSTQLGFITIDFNESGNAQINATGGVSLVSSSTFSAASFEVTGENDASFTISLPADNAISLTRTGGGTMLLTGFNHNSNLALDEDGTASFSVGATLNVNANQEVGEYSGSFDVIITYQ